MKEKIIGGVVYLSRNEKTLIINTLNERQEQLIKKNELTKIELEEIAAIKDVIDFKILK